jgi:hypothetical protein
MGEKSGFSSPFLIIIFLLRVIFSLLLWALQIFGSLKVLNLISRLSDFINCMLICGMTFFFLIIKLLLTKKKGFQKFILNM